MRLWGRQYYTAILKRNEKFRGFHGYLFKLMETSYFFNYFVNYVSKQLFNNPTEVAWVGDYEGTDMNYVGYWAGDELEFVLFGNSKDYDDYEEILPVFIEGER